VTAALDTPIASGETEYKRYDMQAMIQQKACDILMPDLQRIGGISEMLKVSALASANNMKISTHIFTEHREFKSQVQRSPTQPDVALQTLL
jgi:L-alanine-DL-glutamate epimerase-like enolase superfamily enzyme